MMLSREACEDVMSVLSPEHFFGQAHQVVAEVLWQMVSDGEQPHVVSVQNALRAANRLAQAGGPDTLDAAITRASYASAARAQALRIAEMAKARAVYLAGKEIVSGAPEHVGDVDSFISQCEAQLADIRDSGVSRGTPVTWSDAMHTMADKVLSGDQDEIVPTGLLDLDDILAGGFRPTELVTVGARTSVGKTAFGVSVACNVASRGHPVAYCSMEMHQLSIAERVASAVGRVDLQALRKRRLNDREVERLERAVTTASGWPLYVQDSSKQSALDVQAWARKVRRQTGTLPLVVVDYVQQLRPVGRSDRRDLEVADSVWMLKSLAMDMGLPVLMLAQINRQPGSRLDQRPHLHDLRETGAIEMDSDVVLMLHREHLVKPDPDNEHTAEVIVRKQRNGPLGTVPCAFLGRYGRFESMARG